MIEAEPSESADSIDEIAEDMPENTANDLDADTSKLKEIATKSTSHKDSKHENSYTNPQQKSTKRENKKAFEGDEGLEERVRKEDIQLVIDSEGGIHPTWMGKRVYGENGSNQSKYGNTTAKTEGSSDEEKDGAIALIYHQNPATGEVEFYLEEKSPDYSPRRYAGALALIGGGVKRGEGHFEALVREFDEELNEPAKSILINALKENKKPYFEIADYEGGLKVINYVYRIEVKPEEEWKKIKSSEMTKEAGISRVRTLDQIVGTSRVSWAWNHFDIITGFIYTIYPTKVQRAYGNVYLKNLDSGYQQNAIDSTSNPETSFSFLSLSTTPPFSPSSILQN